MSIPEMMGREIVRGYANLRKTRIQEASKLVSNKSVLKAQREIRFSR